MPSLEKLDRYLSSDDSHDECMMLSDLDGFLTAVVCSPEIIRPEEWLNMALGQTMGTPDWVLKMLIQMHQDILDGLEQPSPFIEPVFWEAAEGHVIAMDWCEGFMQGVSLQPDKWLRLNESKHGTAFMTPIMVHMLDDHGNSLMGIAQEELDQVLDDAAKRIPDVVPKIFSFWRK